MATPGQFSVTASGAFTYAMPIAVPPGPAGMVPSLSLDYSSQNGDGLEGIGFTLSGLPAIRRCAGTIAQDGASADGVSTHGAVNFDDNDHYCLEGQRLVKVNSSSACYSGTQQAFEYRTEIDGFSRVVGCWTTAIATGPTYFRVWTKSGQIMDFGYTVDSRVKPVLFDKSATLSVIGVWAVDKISDVKGNSLSVVYNCGSTTECTDDDRVHNGQIYPLQISYGGGHRSVNFVYGPRPDLTPIYQANTIQTMTKLLSDVVTCTDVPAAGQSCSSVVTDYKITYTPWTDNFGHSCCSRIDHVKACNSTAGTTCLKPTAFNWQGYNPIQSGPMTGRYTNNLANGDTHSKPNNFNADFNSDGVPDAAVLTAGDNHNCTTSDHNSHPTPRIGTGVYNWFGDGAEFASNYPGLSTPMQVTYAHGNSDYNCNGAAVFYNTGTEVIDVDGDGFDDVASDDVDNPGRTFILRNNQDGTFSEASGTGNNNGWRQWVANLWGDYNGDGRSDYLYRPQSGGTIHPFFSQGMTSSGIQFLESTGMSYSVRYNDPIYGGDFDGDGCADVLYQPMTSGTSGFVFKFCNSANTFAAPTDWIYAGYAIALGDFNGDGKTDVLRYGGGVKSVLLLSTGTQFVAVNTNIDAQTVYNTPLVGDFNGDGRADIAFMPLNGHGTEVPIYISEAPGSSDTDPVVFVKTTSATVADNKRGAVVGDWNGDGASDIWIQDATDDVQFYYNNPQSGYYQPQLLTSVSNGMGAITYVTYDRINATQFKFYTKGTSSQYPEQDIDGPLYTVKEIDSSNGVDSCTSPLFQNCYASTYKYAGLVANMQGRGLLGFSTVTVTDKQTQMVQTTNYYTKYPFTGLISSQTKTCPAAVCGHDIVVSSTTNCYSNSSTTCSTTAPTAFTFTIGGDISRYLLALRSTTTTAAEDAIDPSTNQPYVLPGKTTTYRYDCDTTSNPCYGLTTYTDVATTLGGTTVSDVQTTNTYYTANTSLWFLDRLQQTQVTTTANGNSVTRTSGFAYDSATGLLTDETVEPGDSGCFYLNTHYHYDAFGNKDDITTTPRAGCGAVREATAAFDASTYYGAFLSQATNATGTQSEYWTNYDIKFGGATGHTGPNGLKASFQYDGFGRKTLEQAFEPNGTTVHNKKVVDYQYCTGLPTGETCTLSPHDGTDTRVASFYAIVTPQTAAGAQNGPIAITFYDALSRMVAADTQTYDGSWVRVATEYDAKGRVWRTSRPYCLNEGTLSCPIGSGTPHWTVNSYVNPLLGVEDPFGRVQSVTQPDSGVSTVTYKGLTTISTVKATLSGTPQSTTTVKNGRGLVATVTDANNQSTSYLYDPVGNLVQITAPNSVVSTFTYDTSFARRKVASSDPDMGNWSYAYDAYDELTSQTDANGKVTTLQYDVLGRVIRKSATGSNANFVYDGAAGDIAAIGKLTKACVRSDSATGCDGLGTNDYLKTLTYDTLGRLVGVTLTIRGATPYAYTTHYTTDDRPDWFRYPSNFKLKYLYTSSTGFLCRISLFSDPGSDCTSSTGTNYWTANVRDWEGHLVQQTVPGGTSGVQTIQSFDPATGRLIQVRASADGADDGSLAHMDFGFDLLGNLLTRSDDLLGLNENFCYDALNRLTNSAVTSGSNCSGPATKTVAYDAEGNITRKSDISLVGGYHYGTGAPGQPGPHAVVSIDTCAGCTVNGTANPKYAYDAAGNMTCMMTSSQTSCTAVSPQRIFWTAFNMIDRIALGGPIPAGLQFTYDADYGRIEQCVPDCTGATAMTTYLNGLGAASEKFVSGGTTTWRDYVIADGRLVALHTRSGTIQQMRYFVLDHLGSVAVVTDETGAVTERLSYDAWGRHRHGNDWTDDPTCTSGSATTTRGFTGQEEMDSVCDVNLNARVYDPTIGRFLSPDSVTETVYNLQVLNRYSYVGNNPLSYTDPSGHCFLGCFWSSGIFRAVVAIVAAATLQAELSSAELAASTTAELSPQLVVLNAGISGGVSGYITTGRLNGALLGSLEGVAFAGVHFAKADLGVDTGTVGGALTSAGMHASVGGLFSMAGGTKFGSGFLAAGFSDLAGTATDDDPGVNALDLTRHAVVGGVGSVLGGGKFANGAVTGAFGYLYNQELQVYMQNQAFGDAYRLTHGTSKDQIVREHRVGNLIGAIVTLPVSIADIAIGLVGGGGIVVYRGVSSESPAFFEAVQGTASARGAILDPVMHNAGLSESTGYTSWTTSYETALSFATNGGRTTGVILQQTVPRSALILSPDAFYESEVLREGTVTGAQVHWVNPW